MNKFPTSRGSQRRESVSRRIGHHWPGVAALYVSFAYDPIQLTTQNQTLAVAPCDWCHGRRFGFASTACRRSHFSCSRGYADCRSPVLSCCRGIQEVREEMSLKTNKRGGVDAGWPVVLHLNVLGPAPLSACVRRCRLLWRMMRLFKRYRAVGKYFWRLSQELERRFGKKNYYSIAEVSRSAQQGNFGMTYIAYAHGMFCSRGDFAEHYASLGLACDYDGVRQVVGRRFFSGALGFDAMNILIRAGPPMSREYAFEQSAPSD
jgi:hypothetical protein